jgi:hypothetical protein
MNERRPETPAGGEGRVEALLRAGRAAAFEPGFAWRVMHRLRAEEADPSARLAAAVQRHFVRLAPLAALATGAFATLNLRAADARQTPLEAVLGLPALTVEQAYRPYSAAAERQPVTETKG